MEVVGDASGSEPGEIRALKPCLLRRNHSREQHGVAASCLEELRSKACDILAIDKSLAPVTLVLAEDGTIVDDDDYFLCLPSNTKFVALARNEKWAYHNSDGGTAWISQESFDVDETDSGAGLKWKNVARQLKEDLSSIILLSEDDLQVLIDVPCSDLAQELCQSCVTVRGLQNTLQQVLDQREEARQSKQLLELYLQALEKEGSVLSKQQESKAGFSDESDAVDTGLSRERSSETALTSQLLTALKEKPAPELSLSSQDLEPPSTQVHTPVAGSSGRAIRDTAPAWPDEQCHIRAQDPNQRNLGPPKQSTGTPPLGHWTGPTFSYFKSKKGRQGQNNFQAHNEGGRKAQWLH
ncbi:DNA fragmentation factor subunit alpha isoform X1 [Equus asinus]|uniref:DNA fragmentation factor subunit alpha n=1 Tax=Equus asinus TaxID=9793 RepID=A0A9L0KA17_EQUAS|nr:DNA fragmentation factor subunit alpha isoform X1 [Equus asinus]